jgi:hypothetical protein
VILFPSWFLAILVYGAIAITAAGAVVLGVLLIRDFRQKRLW